MRLISFDTETELIARGRQVPPVVVGSFAELDLTASTPHIKDKGLISRHDLHAWLIPLLDDPDVHFTGANIAYDVLVTSAQWPNPDPDAPFYDEDILARWVKAYDAGRVTDLLTRQKLLDLAAGCYRREQLSDGRWQHHRYNLGSLAWRLCRMQLDKGDPRKAKKLSTSLTVAEQAAAVAAAADEHEEDSTEEQENSWRLRYAELKNKPIAEWPEAARKYPLDDGITGALVWWEQESGRPHLSPALTEPTEPTGPTEPGYNIFSGSTEGNGFAAALTNPTELARYKGILSRSYPVEYGGKLWPDVETAYHALSGAAAAGDALMVDLIAAKFRQHPRLLSSVRSRGGVAWLESCSHFTGAKSHHMQEWEGRGTASRFIRNLIAGYTSVAGHGGEAPRRITATPAGPSALIWAKIRENFGANADPLVDEHRQARSALWLRVMSAHGLRTDPIAVEKFAGWVEAKHKEVNARLVKCGLVRVKWHLNRDALKAWVEKQCKGMNAAYTGVKKAELLQLAELLGPDDAATPIALAAADWLALSKVLRFHNATKPEAETLEAAQLDAAIKRFMLLESAGLAFCTYCRNTKAAAVAMVEACERAGVSIPRTDSYDPKKHSLVECIALDKEACQSVRDGDLNGALADYSELSHLSKMMSTDIPVLRGGVLAPIHTHFEELLETGRTGSSAPNVQNVARGDKNKPGARECFVPRERIFDAATRAMARAVLIDSDYSLGELHTLAQACLWLLGYSRLAEVLRDGKDPHTAMACRILGIEYDEGVKRKKSKDPDFDNARNSGKGINFGKPGGLGVETMRAYGIRSYGIDLPTRCDCYDTAACKCRTWEKLLKLWESLWTEMPDYFRWVDAQRSKKGRRVVDRGTKGVKLESLYNIRQPFSNRLRAGATYCSACNSIFQGLLADILKRAGWYLFKACYLSPETMQAYRIPMSDSTLTSEAEYFALLEQSRSLYGCRPVNEIHDQFLIEAPEERGDAAATATGLLMNRAGAEILPDVPVKCEPILARRWSKRAEEKRADGKLIAWEDPRL